MRNAVKGLFLSILGLLAMPVVAGSSSIEESVRSAILARLPGQIYWPESSDLNDKHTAYRLCIYRDNEYFISIQNYLKDQIVNGEKIQILFTSDLKELNRCHVAYVGDVSRAEVNEIVGHQLIQHTIFVASSEFSAAMGLHIRLYVGAEETTRFEVNRSAFEISGSEPRVTFVKLAEKIYQPSRKSPQ